MATRTRIIVFSTKELAEDAALTIAGNLFPDEDAEVLQKRAQTPRQMQNGRWYFYVPAAPAGTNYLDGIADARVEILAE